MYLLVEPPKDYMDVNNGVRPVLLIFDYLISTKVIRSLYVWLFLGNHRICHFCINRAVTNLWY